MPIRVLPDFLINQIAAGEVIERPASVVKELVENALDAGATQIIIDAVDGGRTLISVIDNGHGMSKQDLSTAILRHATSKLPSDDLTNISFMGFRGEALPSIASVSSLTIDTCNGKDSNGWTLIADTNEIKPSSWETGTRIRVNNLFSKTPARLKFLHTDKAELLAIVDTVKHLAMARPDVGFTINNKWYFNKDQDLLERIISVMGEDTRNNMIEIDAFSKSSDMHLYGFISQPTLHRASSTDQYLFVNNRPVKDKLLISALRASYMDVMHAREFPLCALYLDLPSRNVDVNVSPAKTDVHFLEPTHISGFIIKNLREALSKTLNQTISDNIQMDVSIQPQPQTTFCVCEPKVSVKDWFGDYGPTVATQKDSPDIYQETINEFDLPLGRVIGQLGNKYILAENKDGLVIIDQHAAHERITYEKLRTHKMLTQPLLTPIIVNLKAEDVIAVLSASEYLKNCGLTIDSFGDTAIAIFEKPAEWDLNWEQCLKEMADEIKEYGNSVKLSEKLHLKLANYACHHSVRAGRKLNYQEMNTLLRDIEKTEHGSECNHGRPVYKKITITELDTLFERI
ncbi:MAG: DNA mismatch repair endonuclease MutL [Alphaproteobacteria bacterium]|nr:DNA mismatch repair endonuclease MutL [Alphaproteobacteria bacterium]